MTSRVVIESNEIPPRERESILASTVVANLETSQHSIAESALPRYAVVIATYNRGARIVPVVASMLRSEISDFEFVIVDQSPHDETRRALEPFLGDPRIRYVHCDIAGTSRARNRGFELTTAPIIAITDDDCIVPPDWLSRLAAPFKMHPEIGVVYCNVEPAPCSEPGHTPQIRFPETRLIRSLRDLRPSQPLWMGAGMAIRRSILTDVQGFDEMLGPGCAFSACEDNDIAWRGLVRGWWICENADATVVHDGFRTLEQLRAHGMRDFYGIGGTLAKYLKTGHLRIAAMAIPLLFRFGAVAPMKDLLNGRPPQGLRRPYMLARGFFDGLRAPLNRTTGHYRPPLAKRGTASIRSVRP
ncbi:glycosyltransferase [Bradyrhizobium sp. 200]|uniref:glycosyltransferase family 2 protein n=1 Tax=Bradyrhizobium sp. 200 TaxID=2782665 RepID=UPI001FFE4A87|nr:glycosyltransferase family 2 protein [Bradyrhizobium sp. 200]UPJ51695.1 glycosyltransferase [Bradyrhizobium sp. 200]